MRPRQYGARPLKRDRKPAVDEMSNQLDSNMTSSENTCDKSWADMVGDPIAGAVRSKLGSATVMPGLHIVATPIGNLADITLRALAVLGRADVIACEDTRVTSKLKSVFGLTASLLPYHDHNAAKAGAALIKRLKNGEIVALVSDAGTPLISDPGYRLVGTAIGANIPVFSVPGPTATIAALVVSGLPTDRFFYAGFLPSRSGARREVITGLATIPATLIVYESPRRLSEALADMAQIMGPRDAAVARELTKRHEEVRRGTLADLASHYCANDTPKGEIVVVIGPAGQG
ncbi:16S rRNA (cytidine(1402)-2'-O)-methyltransferase, partial [Alphaproteobacteria bacterium]|nr:16S rRNA (cytidine(1402)-2'-O)-methyltransferase [Alphaproteobacteria bacterium]